MTKYLILTASKKLDILKSFFQDQDEDFSRN